MAAEIDYGKYAEAGANFGLERLVKETDGAPITHPSDGKEVAIVACVRCAGRHSDKESHLPYCSGFRGAFP